MVDHGLCITTGSAIRIVQEAEVPIVDQGVCRNQFPTDLITDNMMCAGILKSGVDSCVVSF